MRAPFRTVLFALASAATPLTILAGEVVPTPEGLEFQEDFPWEGNHAATIAAGVSTTVWWDEASWDVRGDTAFTHVEPQGEGIDNTFHVDIHKATSAPPTDGSLDNTVYAVGGTGGPGVGVMHLDFQDILSARLRNPLLVSAERPGVVEFYATTFVTTGHWWEIALTPADQTVPGEYTGVPGQDENGLPPPIGDDRQPGPGHSPALDSVNLVSFGATDVPCTTGWWTRFGVTRSVDGTTTHHVNQVESLDELTPTDPAQADVLVSWRVEVRPDSLRLLLDLEDDGSFALVEEWSLSIPWPEMHVQLLAVAYQADHHPGDECFQGHIRELKWRHVRVRPVRWAATDVTPKNDGTTFVGREEGWLAYELRDIQRLGPASDDPPQPNEHAFGTDHPGRYCNEAGFPCFGADLSAELELHLPPTPDGLQLADAKVLADLKRGFSTSVEDPVVVRLGGEVVGSFQPAKDTPAVEDGAWIRRATALPVPSLLTARGSVDLRLELGTGAFLDRIEVELGYEAAVLFSDGFESGSTSAWQ